MCARYTLTVPARNLLNLFNAELEDGDKLQPRYNIAPSQLVPAIRRSSKTDKRELSFLQWGLIPSWAKDPAIGSRLINARAETLEEKPSFRAAYKARRCLLPADGFYEWKQEDKRKQPYYFQLKDHEPFAFAGLWESWRDPHIPDKPPVETCTLITTSPNDLLKPIHDRMPVLLSPEDFDEWLSDDRAHPALLRPFPAEAMQAFPVSTEVNNPRHDSPELTQPIG